MINSGGKSQSYTSKYAISSHNVLICLSKLLGQWRWNVGLGESFNLSYHMINLDCKSHSYTSFIYFEPNVLICLSKLTIGHHHQIRACAILSNVWQHADAKIRWPLCYMSLTHEEWPYHKCCKWNFTGLRIFSHGHSLLTQNLECFVQQEQSYGHFQKWTERSVTHQGHP